jgi:hypothetical protein
VTIKPKSTHFFSDWKNIRPKKSPGLEQPNFGEGFSALAKSFSKKIIFFVNYSLDRNHQKNGGKIL